MHFQQDIKYLPDNQKSFLLMIVSSLFTFVYSLVNSEIFNICSFFYSSSSLILYSNINFSYSLSLK